MNAFDILAERGFVQQSTGEERLREGLAAGPVTLYLGIDATADSMHIGHLLPVMACAHLQRAGHRPILIVGGGTAMVGDPSGKTELRQMLTEERIQANAEGIRRQLERFLVVDGERGLLLNNADWLLDLKYIPFLRDIGRHFSVNRMLSAEAYKLRLEKGLSFIEFNYQLLQAYDFLELFRRHRCTLQVGGDDQWGNILAGVDLIRRIEGAEVHGLTFPLITTASGAKMGKTAAGAVWIDPERVSPFDYFQYWLNVDDRDVGRFLRLYTFLPVDRIAELEGLQGAEIREAKRVLAREATALVHGEDEAERADEAARAMVAGVATAEMPSHAVSAADLREGIKVYALLADAGITKSRGEARRVIQQGGVSVNGDRVEDVEASVAEGDLQDGAAVLRVGKKRAVRIVAGA